MFKASDVQALKDSLPELDFDAGVQDSALLSRYLQHYGLHTQALRSTQTHAIHHAMGFFLSAGFRIACQYFRPEHCRGTVIIVHGYYDHVGLYAHIIRYCLQRRLAVVAFDLPGHGLSSGEPAAIDSFAQYTQVFADCVQRVQAAELSVALHVLAQSTGGAIVMGYCLHDCARAAQQFAHIVLLAPLLRPHGWARGRIQHAFAKIFVSSVARDFTINSHDEAFLRFLQTDDPLQYRRLMVSWVSALKDWLKRYGRYAPCSIALSVVQGTQDTTVDWHYNLPQITAKFPRTQVFMLPEARHHLANESEELRRQLFALLDEIL